MKRDFVGISPCGSDSGPWTGSSSSSSSSSRRAELYGTAVKPCCPVTGEEAGRHGRRQGEDRLPLAGSAPLSWLAISGSPFSK
ncbi:uncharacterized protein V6R79_017106 [Siganus canaliculatus]